MPANRKPAKKAATSLGSGWGAKKATASAIQRFEEAFERDMGVSPTVVPSYQVNTTGSLALDYALTVGGYPEGRIVEMWGPEHAGKTTLAMVYCAAMQRLHPERRIAWVDMEQTFDEAWAGELGLDTSKIWFFTPKTAEETADAVKRFTESGLCSVVTLDSVGGMISRIEFEKESDDATVGLVAKIVTRMVKQCSPMAHTNGTTIFVVNQVRAVIGAYGADQDTAGGWALKHVTTMKLQVRRGTEVKLSVNGVEEVVGHDILVRVQKNKCGPKGRLATLTLFNQPTARYGPIGIDQASEAFDYALRHGAIAKEKPNSSWLVFAHSGHRVNGKEQAVAHMRENSEALAEVRRRVLAAIADQALSEGSDDDSEMDEQDLADSLNMDQVL